MQKKILQTTMVIVYWKSFMFYQIFLSPQVKRSLIMVINWYTRVVERIKTYTWKYEVFLKYFACGFTLFFVSKNNLKKTMYFVKKISSESEFE